MSADSQSAELKFCPRCGAALAAGARFCSQCGNDIARYRAKSPLSGKALGAIILLGLLIFGVTWYVQEPLIGKPPTEQFKGGASTEAKPAPEADEPLEPELQKLRDAAEKSPRDKAAWFAYASALGKRLSSKDAPRNLIFEAIGALRQILDIDPNDKDALLTMAEISFQQQAFGKSAEFYEKYLAIVPEDIDVRARYASSLSFVGKFDEALKELNKVLSVKPAHFHALAYSAVTYAEMGNRDKAREVGEQALKNAPSDEAKERFRAFLTSLDQKEEKSTHGATRGTMPEAAAVSGAAEETVNHIKNNPVAGKKFIKAEMVDPATLKVTLDNFPMSQMPPFVKDKFVSGIKEKAFAPGSELKSVILYDQVSAAELETLTR